MNRRNLRASLILIILLLVQAAMLGAPQNDGRIISVADIHGDYDSFTALLQQAGLLDADHRWSGGRATFVQTGDFTDRGPKARQVMDLLMDLPEQADDDDGKAIILMGNHEMMNMMGDLQSVTGDDYASFVDDESEERRMEAFEDYLDFLEERSERLGLPPVDGKEPEIETLWMEAHPPGFVEHREAFSPRGKYGRWLRSLPTIAREGDTIFLHAGISSPASALSLDRINDRIREEIGQFDRLKDYLIDRDLALPFFTLNELVTSVREERDAIRSQIATRQAEAAAEGDEYDPSRRQEEHLEVLGEFLAIGGWLSVHPEGILWFRGFNTLPDREAAALLEELRKDYDALHFVTGHSPQRTGRVRARFDGGFFVADTGMLSTVYLGGRPSAMEIRDGVFRAIYLGQESVQLYPPPNIPE